MSSKVVAEFKETRATKASEQSELVKTIGAKMREARELCGYSQTKAAKLLGYKNSSKLAKIENATDTNSVPISILHRASKVYDVSLDFLFGVSDDWERDPVVSQQRVVGQWLYEHWERAKNAEVNAIRVLFNKLSVIEKAATHAVTRSKENHEAVTRVQEINPQFDDMKGGARLLRLLAETAEEAMGISHELKRVRSFVEVAKTENVNLDIFKDEGFD